MFESLLGRIGSTLDQADIAYMVIGGQAVLVYGEPRLTRDIDITLGATLDRLADVVELLATMELFPLADPETFTRKTMVLPCRDPETAIRVDFIFSFSPYEQQALERVRLVEIAGTAVRFASPEDLLVHKVVAGRPRDLEDVKSILLKNPDVDIGYIKAWLEEFSSALAEPYAERFDHILTDVN
jgi:hypothetical protein